VEGAFVEPGSGLEGESYFVIEAPAGGLVFELPEAVTCGFA
jgi:hypothetical protein